MTAENRKQFAPDDLAALFRALEQSGSACVLMGGQAVNYWALRYWARALPHTHIARSALPELSRMRELAAPRWLAKIALSKRAIPEGDSLLRLLEILARHAEPWCAQPAPRRGSRNTQHATRSR